MHATTLRRPIHRQKPRICKVHALQGACRNHGCKYSHDYSLSELDTAKSRKAAKEVPCHSVASADGISQCQWGEADCIYGQ